MLSYEMLLEKSKEDLIYFIQSFQYRIELLTNINKIHEDRINILDQIIEIHEERSKSNE